MLEVLDTTLRGGAHIRNTVGVSENIIEASLRALRDSIDNMLAHNVPGEKISCAFPLISGMDSSFSPLYSAEEVSS